MVVMTAGRNRLVDSPLIPALLRPVVVHHEEIVPRSESAIRHYETKPDPTRRSGYVVVLVVRHYGDFGKV